MFITKAEAAATPDGDSAIWVVFGFLLYGAFVVLFTVLVPVITNAIISGVGVQTAIGAVAGQRGISPIITPLAGAGNLASRALTTWHQPVGIALYAP